MLATVILLMRWAILMALLNISSDIWFLAYSNDKLYHAHKNQTFLDQQGLLQHQKVGSLVSARLFLGLWCVTFSIEESKSKKRHTDSGHTQETSFGTCHVQKTARDNWNGHRVCNEERARNNSRGVFQSQGAKLMDCARTCMMRLTWMI